MPTSTLFVGIDVSLKSNQACAMNFNQDVFFNSSFDNTPDGTALLIKKILDEIIKHPELKKIEVCLESTSVYHVHVSNSLAMSQELKEYDIKVYPQNAKTIAKYKESFIDREKTDSQDAYLCADYVRVGKCKNSHAARGYQKLALQRLTRQRKHVAESIAKEKQYVLNNIFIKYSALLVKSSDESYLNNTFSKTAMHILTEFLTIDEIVDSGFEELVKRIEEVSRNRFSDSIEVAKLFQKVYRDSYRLDKTTSEYLNVTLASSFRLIEFYKLEMKNLDKEIERLIKGYNSNYLNILMSIPGFGLVYSAGIIAEIEDIRFFPNHGKLAAYAGLRWKRKQSGDKDSEHRKSTTSSNAYLRYYVTEATSHIIKHVDEYHAYFYKKHEGVTINKYKRALVLTSRKVIRLIFGLLRKNQLFDIHYLDQAV